MASDRSVCDKYTGRLTPMGPVTGRSMFGGFGIFMEGLMFGLVADDELYFKVDDGNRGNYEAVGSQPFTYEGKSRPVEMSYWKMPSGVLDDETALIVWAKAAYDAAKRAKKLKRQPNDQKEIPRRAGQHGRYSRARTGQILYDRRARHHDGTNFINR